MTKEDAATIASAVTELASGKQTCVQVTWKGDEFHNPDALEKTKLLAEILAVLFPDDGTDAILAGHGE